MLATQNWEVEIENEIDFDEDGDEKTIEGYTPEQEAQLRGFAKRFQSDVKGLVKGYITEFFKDKMMHCGGKIPLSLLFSDRRVSMVMNYNICNSVDRAYSCLGHMVTAADKRHAQLNGEATDDIKLVNETLNLLSRSFIPQQFAGGMLLLYLEFVEGVNIGTQP